MGNLLNESVTCISVVVGGTRVRAETVLSGGDKVRYVAIVVKDKVRPLPASEPKRRSVRVVDYVSTLAVEWISPCDAGVSPVDSVQRVSVPSLGHKPPVVTGVVPVHVVENGMVHSVRVNVEERVFSSSRSKVREEFNHNLLVRRRVVPLVTRGEVATRSAHVLPCSPDGDHGAVFQDNRCEVGVGSRVLRPQLFGLRPRSLW
mmetsp:Transcript_21336/g.42808  ORF Transcript_21336/g.42808 Transcript_21336/m.42808 type:complete len:203 (+) Transcript_21336:398-1006(+)